MADGAAVFKGNEPVLLAQREFMLKLLTEPGFVAGKRGIHAARALVAARKEIDEAFGGDAPNGEITDETWAALCRILDTLDMTIGTPGRGGGSVIACVLPFMDALLAAELSAGDVIARTG